KNNTFVTGPGTIIKSLRENEKGKYEKFAVWYRVILPLDRRPLIPMLQRFMGDPTKEPIKVGDQSYPGTDFKFPAFFMCAIWVVLVHLNWTEGDNPFREAYLTKTGNPSG